MTAGVVLVGGRSSRMGTAKAALEWHGSTFLRRVTGVVGRAVDGPVIVVRAPHQPLPALGSQVIVCDDTAEGRGPLQGLATGLAVAERERASLAFACSTDLPLLHSAFVEAVLGGFDTAAPADEGATPDVVVPRIRGHRQPLAAAYRTDLATRLDELLRVGRSRMSDLLDDVDVRLLDEATLLADARLFAADPDLASAFNVNTPQDYRAARARRAPEVVVDQFTAVGTELVASERLRTRASDLGAAAQQAGLVLDGRISATINGSCAPAEPGSPLQTGDVVTFLTTAQPASAQVQPSATGVPDPSSAGEGR